MNSLTAEGPSYIPAGLALKSAALSERYWIFFRIFLKRTSVPVGTCPESSGFLRHSEHHRPYDSDVSLYWVALRCVQWSELASVIGHDDVWASVPSANLDSYGFRDSLFGGFL